MKKSEFCILIIIDGWGVDSSNSGNAFHLANTPNLDKLGNEYPRTQLLCSGEAVGLPKGVMGNSEVGHLNIGAGRIVYQDLLRIDMAIKNSEFFENETICRIMSDVTANGSTLHMMGLVSDGGVHSQLEHLLALVDMARKKGVPKLAVHAILDGRDTPPDSGIRYVRQLREHLESRNYGSIASVCGRYYAMDRDNRWDRVEKAYRMYTENDGVVESDPIAAVENAYQRGETDEFVSPAIIAGDDPKPFGAIRDGDGVIFFNFRADRAREITRAFTADEFEHFNRSVRPRLTGYTCMTMYDETFDLPVAFPPVRLERILGEIVSEKGLRQLRIAETEKYAHVTYFFNGGEEKPFPLEDRCLIPSPREVDTYDMKPEMSAREVTAEALSRLRSGNYDFAVLNFANMDMVGHTGIIEAAVTACETVDSCVGEIVDEVRKLGGVALVTADHGNAETMKYEDGSTHTAHTLNPVPFVLVDENGKDIRLREGILGDIAPTILELMGLEKPSLMTGKSLIEK